MIDTGYGEGVDPFEEAMMDDGDMVLVQQGKQCMSCRFDINDGEDMGFPRVCDDCMNEEIEL